MPHGPSVEKPHVLLLLDMITPTGGAERFAVQLALRLDPRRFERTLCVTRWSRRWEDDPAVAATRRELEEAGVELLLIERRARFAFWSWWPLFALLRRRIDVLHAHKFGSNVWGTVIGRLARVPAIIAHEQIWSYSGQRLRRWLDRYLIAPGADLFIAVSEQGRQAMIEVEGIKPDRLAVVRNAIPDSPPGDPDPLRRELSIADDVPLVGVVAVLRPQKRLDVLIAAARRLADRIPELKVVVAGDGPERPRLEALIAENRLEGVVHLLGSRQDVPDILASLDVAVLCSDYEGTPLSVMEYMRAQKPIVATSVGGTPELIEDGVSGLLVPPADPQALAEAIMRMVEDRAAASEMASAARARQQRDYDIDASVRRIEAIYEDLLARSSRRQRVRPAHAA